MVIEQAQITVHAGQEQAFEKKFYEVSEVFRNTEGCHKFRLLRGIDHPQNYALVIQWTSKEIHEAFMQTAEFKQWFTAIKPFLAERIKMEHFERTL